MPEQAHKVCVKEIKRFVSIFILLANVKSYCLWKFGYAASSHRLKLLYCLFSDLSYA